MRLYTVHAPPAGEGGPSAEHMRFVREGFHWLAFLFPFLWLLFHRAWLPLLGYVAVAFAVPALMSAVGLPDSAIIVFALGLHLLVGLEADALLRWSLARKGWRLLGIVLGRDREDAERAFFTRDQDWPMSPIVGRRPPPRLRESEMVGLFQEPGR